MLLLLVQAPQAPPRDAKPQPSVRTATIAGRVVDAETNAPIASARVYVRREGRSERPIGVETGPLGDFQVNDLPPGPYRIAATPPDFRATHVSHEITTDRARKDLRIPLPRAVALDGQVVDENGEPMPGVMVLAHGDPGMAMGRRGSETDDRGRFRLFGLRAARYRVCATPARNARTSTANRAAPYLTTCFPSAPNGGGEIISAGGGSPTLLTIVMQRLPGYAISGRTRSESGHASLHVTVIRLGQAASSVIPVDLQAGGVFKAQGLPPGRYLVHANAGAAALAPFEPGAIERAYRIVDLSSSNVGGLELVTSTSAWATIAQDLALLEPEAPPNPVSSHEDPPPPVNVPSKPRGLAISGRVADEDGHPLAGITVRLARGASAPGAARLAATTDDRGSFRLFDLPSGRHVVCASTGASLPPFDVDIRRRRIFVATCSNEISLTSLDVEHSDLRMQRRDAYVVTGHTLSADGEVVPVGAIQLTRAEEAAPVYAGALQPSGSFRLADLLPGSYIVSARSAPSRYGPQDLQWGAVRVEVTAADVDGVVLQLKRGASARGLVSFEDLPPVIPRLQVETRWADAGSRPSPPPTALVAADGTFELEGLFGPVVVTVRANSVFPYAVSALRYRGKDVMDQAIEFDGGPGDGLEVVLTNRTATLAGALRDSTAGSPANAVVICFPVDPQRWAHFGSRRVETSRGAWSLPSLVAGEYYIAALTPEDATALVLPADYARIAEVAQRVKVDAREVRTTDLQVVTLPVR